MREADAVIWGDRTGVAHEVLTHEELDLCALINEAAERIDDAHEEWLEEQYAKLEAHISCLIV